MPHETQQEETSIHNGNILNPAFPLGYSPLSIQDSFHRFQQLVEAKWLVENSSSKPSFFEAWVQDGL